MYNYNTNLNDPCRHPWRLPILLFAKCQCNQIQPRKEIEDYSWVGGCTGEGTIGFVLNLKMSFFGAGGDGSTTARGTASGSGFLSLGTESGRGFRSLGTESGNGLRILTPCAVPAAVDAECTTSGGAGEVEMVEAAGLAEIVEEALGAGDGRGAGEALFVEEDLDRLTTGAGLGGKLRISSTFCEGTLNLTIFVGRSSGCGVGSCGRGRLGGLIVPAPLFAPLRDIRTG
jgi:hypothetical protein